MKQREIYLSSINKSYHPSVTDVINFLSEIHNRNCGYSTIYKAKFVIASKSPSYVILHEHPLSSRFMKCLYNIKATKPKIGYAWDVSLVFEYSEKGSDNSGLTEKVLSQKLVTSVFLLGGKRINTLLSF